jgi:hypothetical protein
LDSTSGCICKCTSSFTPLSRQNGHTGTKLVYDLTAIWTITLVPFPYFPHCSHRNRPSLRFQKSDTEFGKRLPNLGFHRRPRAGIIFRSRGSAKISKRGIQTIWLSRTPTAHIIGVVLYTSLLNCSRGVSRFETQAADV